MMTDAKRSDTDNTEASLNVHIGSLDDMGARFAAAWHAGKAVTRDNTTFLTLEAFIAMSPAV
jgi:hypothetical protein